MLSTILFIISLNSSLNGNTWTVQKEGCAEQVNAPVPGTVARAYMEAGLLEDIRYDDNVRRADQEFFNSDFRYRTIFDVPSDKLGGTVLLNFDGINWKADVILNGEQIGHIDGAFKRSRFDISGKVRKNGNELVVKIIHNAHPGESKFPTLYKSVRNGGILGADNPTFHASIGWDWLPPVPGRNIGIWNDVFLSFPEKGISIDDAFFDTEIPGLLPGQPKSDVAEIYPAVSIFNHNSSPMETRMTIRFGESELSRPVTLQPGVNRISTEALLIDNPHLWWPVDYGEPFLYDAVVSLETGGMQICSRTFKCGIRQMQYTIENSGLQMYINGRRFIPHGGNWGFSDINLNYTAREYDIALSYHADMHFNIVRNWVGQVGDDEFYETCDRLGILVWQDFWLANPADGPDPDDKPMFMDNARDMVMRIRNHPSVILFCGRNEGNPPMDMELRLRNLVKELCPRSLYITSSADYCLCGRGPYHSMSPKDIYDIKLGNNCLHSERGATSIPSYESLCRMFRPEHRWPQNDVWALHNFTLGGAQKCSTVNDLVARGLGEPASLKEFSDRAQWVNYNSLRALFESRGTGRHGLMIWMSHPAWPCLVFQVYDYWFDVNGGYFGAKKGCAPLRISWNPLACTVEAVNECKGDLKGLTAYVSVLNFDGTTAFSSDYSLSLGDDSTVSVCSLKPSEMASSELYYVKLVLKDAAGKVLADNFYWEGREEGNWTAIQKIAKPKLKLSYKCLKDGLVSITVENKSAAPEPMVRLKLSDRKTGEQILPAFYEDNYFALQGGEKKTLTVKYLSEREYEPVVTLEQLR